jgi:hypothetical protein
MASELTERWPLVFWRQSGGLCDASLSLSKNAAKRVARMNTSGIADRQASIWR